MIVYPAKHLFEAMFPQLEDHEEEVFYPHPILDIKCNQLGMLYMDENKFFIQTSKGREVVRRAEGRGDERHYTLAITKQRVVFECYRGEVTEKGSHLFYLNGNPMDLREANLKMRLQMSAEEIKTATAIKKAFVVASAEHLISLEDTLQKTRGVDPDVLIKFLNLPKWLVAERARIKGIKVKKPTRPSTISKDDWEQIVKLGKEGHRMTEIAKMLGYKHLNKIRGIFLKEGLPTKPKKVIK